MDKKTPHYIVLVLLIVLVLASCQPSQAAIETAIASTQVALPTATPIPFSEFNLEGTLIQENDLPAGYSGAQVSNFAPEAFKNVPKADYTISQQFEKNGQQNGSVTVFLYEDLTRQNNAYSTIAEGLTNERRSVEGEWDRGELVSINITFPLKLILIDMVFSQCHAVVHIRFTASDSENNMITYAERLSKRLTPIVCR